MTRSPTEYWEMISERVCLAVAALQRVDAPARDRIANSVTAEAGVYAHDGEVRIPGMARCIVGTR